VVHQNSPRASRAQLGFGNIIKTRRQQLDLSRAELAQRVGCAHATLASIEQGKRRPSRQIAELLAHALEIPPAERVGFMAHARGNHAGAPLAQTLPPSNLPALLAPVIPRPTEIAELGALLIEQRVRQFKPRFTATLENARALVEICERLEGLPLALELAAARLREFSPAQLAAQLNAAILPIAAGTLRDVSPRHQTLRQAIAWSYALLDDASRRVFRALGVFRGGFTFEAAASVCADATRDRLMVLVVHNLIRGFDDAHDSPEDKARLTMLETLREFAWEQLAEHEELETLQRRHAEYFTGRANNAFEVRYTTPLRWQAWLLNDEPNLRAALGWSAERDPELGLELAGAFTLFWENAGYQAEGAQWLEKMLTRQGKNNATRARGLLGLGWLTRRQDRAQAERAGQEALALYRRLKNRDGQADAMLILTEIAMHEQLWECAEQLGERGLSLARALGANLRVADAYATLANIARTQKQFARAYTLQTQAFEVARPFGDSVHLAWLLTYSANDARLAKDLDRCYEHLQDAERIFVQHRANLGLLFVAAQRVSAALMQNDLARAEQFLYAALPLVKHVKAYAGDLVAQAGILAIRHGDFVRGAQYLAAAEHADPEQFKRMDSDERADYEECVLQVRAALGDKEFEQTWEEGSELTLERALGQIESNHHWQIPLTVIPTRHTIPHKSEVSDY